MSRKRRTPRHRPARIARANRANMLRMLSGWLNAGELESALAWVVMEAGNPVLADISTRTIGITEAVAGLHGITDDIAKMEISTRVCAALAVDAMTAAELGDDNGQALDKTLAALNRELSPRVGVR